MYAHVGSDSYLIKICYLENQVCLDRDYLHLFDNILQLRCYFKFKDKMRFAWFCCHLFKATIVAGE